MDQENEAVVVSVVSQQPIVHPYHPGMFLPPPPPEDAKATPGENYPTGRICDRCGVLNQWWTYNPFVRAWQVTGGWALSMMDHCQCPGNTWEDFQERRRQEDQRAISEMQVYGRPWDQRDADRLIPSSWWSGKKFSTFDLKLSPRCREMFQVCAERAATAARPGCLFIGPPGIGKTHLLAALLLQERERGVTTALVTDLKLGFWLTEPLTEENRVRLALTRRILREVDHLGIVNLLADTRLPSETRAMQYLIEDREQHGRATSVTVIENPAKWRKFGGTAAIIGTRLLQTLHGPLIAPPDTQPPCYRSLVAHGGAR